MFFCLFFRDCSLFIRIGGRLGCDLVVGFPFFKKIIITTITIMNYFSSVLFFFFTLLLLFFVKCLKVSRRALYKSSVLATVNIIISRSSSGMTVQSIGMTTYNNT